MYYFRLSPVEGQRLPLITRLPGGASTDPPRCRVHSSSGLEERKVPLDRATHSIIYSNPLCKIPLTPPLSSLSHYRGHDRGAVLVLSGGSTRGTAAQHLHGRRDHTKIRPSRALPLFTLPAGGHQSTGVTQLDSSDCDRTLSRPSPGRRHTACRYRWRRTITRSSPPPQVSGSAFTDRSSMTTRLRSSLLKRTT